MAHPTAFEIVIDGKGGHGSQPHATVDPVLTAAHVVVALQSVVSRNVNYKDQAVVTCTMIHGGEVTNVIPDRVTIKGTTRDLDADVFELIKTRMDAIVQGTCAAYGAKGSLKFDIYGAPGYPCVENHKEQADVVIGLGQKYLKGRVTEEGLPMMGAEDFSYFLHEKPGCFFFLGGSEKNLTGWSQLGAAGQRSNCGCHNTAFDFNDNLLPIAGILFVRIVESRMGLQLYSEEDLPIPLPSEEDRCEGEGGDRAPLPEAGQAAPPPTGPIVINKGAKRGRA